MYTDHVIIGLGSPSTAQGITTLSPSIISKSTFSALGSLKTKIGGTEINKWLLYTEIHNWLLYTEMINGFYTLKFINGILYTEIHKWLIYTEINKWLLYTEFNQWLLYKHCFY